MFLQKSAPATALNVVGSHSSNAMTWAMFPEFPFPCAPARVALAKVTHPASIISVTLLIAASSFRMAPILRQHEMQDNGPKLSFSCSFRVGKKSYLLDWRVTRIDDLEESPKCRRISADLRNSSLIGTHTSSASRAVRCSWNVSR